MQLWEAEALAAAKRWRGGEPLVPTVCSKPGASSRSGKTVAHDAAVVPRLRAQRELVLASLLCCPGEQGREGIGGGAGSR